MSFHTKASLMDMDSIHDDKESLDEIRREKRITSKDKLPPIESFMKFIKIDSSSEVYQNIFSEDPETVNKALKSFGILFDGQISASLPSEEVINQFLNLARQEPIEEISLNASNDLFCLFNHFPTIREYLLKNEFYLFLFRHIRNFSQPPASQFVDNIQQAFQIEPDILTNIPIPDILEIICESISQPGQKVEILVPNIQLLTLFFEFKVDPAIELTPQVAPFLANFLYENTEIQGPVLDFFIASIQYTAEFLKSNDHLLFLIQNCLAEQFSDKFENRVKAVNLLAKASCFCSYFLLQNDIVSTIHAIFSFDNEIMNDEIIKSGFEICQLIAGANIQQAKQLIAEAGVGLGEDLLNFSLTGSYDEKIELLHFGCILFNYIADMDISKFLADISFIQCLTTFLESAQEPYFVDLLRVFLGLHEMSEKNSIHAELKADIIESLNDEAFISSLQAFASQLKIENEYERDLAELAQAILDIQSSET